MKLIYLTLSLISFTAFSYEFRFNLNPYYNIPIEQVQEKLEMFNYPKEFVVEKTNQEDKEQYLLIQKKIEYKSPLTNQPAQAIFDYYQNKKTKLNPAPLILILPPINGASFIDTNIAKYFIRNGYHVIIFHNQAQIDLDIPTTEVGQSWIELTISGRVLLDYIQTLPEIDKNKIAIFGISLGGIRSSLLMSADNRIKAGVFFVTGGNFPEINRYSQQSSIIEWRNKRMEIEGFENLDQFENNIRNNITVDPLYFAPLRSYKDVYLFIGEDDQTVPTKNQMELWHAYGRPNYTIMDKGHVGTAIRSLVNKNKILSFFEERFKQQSDL